MPGFAWYAWRSTRQVRAASGFRGGALITEPGLGFWTVTTWDDEAAMSAYRRADAHGRAMRKLAEWCDEASVIHWTAEADGVPGGETARGRMVADGRLSKVRHPSPAHAAGRIEPKPLRPAAPIRAFGTS